MRVLLFGSGRLEKLARPLDDVSIQHTALSGDFSWADIDVIMCDIPGTTLSKGILYKYLHNIPLVYRMRGNYWQEIKPLPMAKPRAAVANRVLFPQCDGICVPDTYLQTELFTRSSFSKESAAVGIPKEVSDYPLVNHTEGACTLLTLTNFDYQEKIEPLYVYMDVVDQFLQDVDGTWYVAGNGEHATTFEKTCRKYEHVQFTGFIDPTEYLSRSSILLHLSRFDIAAPNAILEAMASGLPVITNDFPPFEETPELITVSSDSELRNRLNQLCSDPAKRRKIGRQAREYVREEHSYTAIGQRYKTFLESIVS